MILAGVTLSGEPSRTNSNLGVAVEPTSFSLDWTRHAMYTQMMIPLKVSMLAERISRTYLRVSDLYIMPAQRFESLVFVLLALIDGATLVREVGHLLQFQEDRSEEGKRLFTCTSF